MSNAFKHDFSDQVPAHKSRTRLPKTKGLKIPHLHLPSPRWYPLFGALAGFIFILLFIGGAGQDARARMSIEHTEWLTADVSTVNNQSPQERLVRVQSGDNAVSVLTRLGFTRTDAHYIVNAAKSSYKLKNINIGNAFKRIDSNSGTDVFYNIDAKKQLYLHQNSGESNWQSKIQKRQILTRHRLATGAIHGSLFASAEKAGMDQRTTMNLVEIFAWDIDFARDIRSGDSFRVVYEERFDDEGNMLESSIFAAEFVNQGKKFESVRYLNAKGKVDYYTPDGKGMQKTYLKAPVKFSRISSRFRTKRKHPILGYTRAHRGVDYAAPSGTPIHALGNGRIKFKGWKSGYGRFILIQHNTREHSTAYAHMRSFARGIKKGTYVKQGQVIGYVGMSGLATGPHLHFEFRSRGRAVNPLTVKLKHPSAPVPKSEMAHFRQQTAPLMGMLKDATHDQSWG
ncbi:peptidoglycan DD-metalloendopeptidase family protein [Mariprofundus sp. EBB-1]|uniref:M23 family metallopeptidase n=1 Tax=Mariprofundus sp. EBB-1 TaxID=2650971 RepID=UPI001F2176E9|nr:peptidoglycan DD-metalloendopeptidase family protein [Mariprofundus sp. EBB-1]